jgi:hypothetical protein
MQEFFTSRGTCTDHCVPTSCKAIRYSTAAPESVPKAQPRPPLNQFSRPAMLGLRLGGGIPCRADDLSAIGWDQVALTVMRPQGAQRRSQPTRCPRRRGPTPWLVPARQHRNRGDNTQS